MTKSLLALAFTFFTSAALRAETPAAPDAPADHQGSKQLVVQSADGVIILHAKDVTVHGANVRYEPKPEKNTVGYWSKMEDWVSWEFEVVKAGKFAVEVLQGCGKGSGGAEVAFAVGEQVLTLTVEDTGGFQNFVPRTLGTLALGAGKYTLTVKPKTKPGGAVMDLRQVTLRPVEK
jgi:arylsulfatase A